MGFDLVATEGTAEALEQAGIKAAVVRKLSEKTGPSQTILDLMKKGEVRLLINTPSGLIARADEVVIRGEAILRGIPIVTTEDGAHATVSAIAHVRGRDWDVHALQDIQARIGKPASPTVPA
jgi:carbamoyl-phosphate synthase large subunit